MRRGRQPLAERRHHAAGDEDVFRWSVRPVVWRHAGPRQFDVGAASRRRTCSRSSGVSTPNESYAVSTALMRMPCSSARSCSSDSARSSGVGSSDGQHEQGAAAIRVEADMSIERRPAAARVARRSGIGAREKYSAKPPRSTTTLTMFGIVELGGIVNAPVERRHLRPTDRRRTARPASSIARGSMQRLVALHVDDDVAVERRGDFGEPIGAGLVRRLASAAPCRRSR